MVVLAGVVGLEVGWVDVNGWLRFGGLLCCDWFTLIVLFTSWSCYLLVL